MKKLITVTAVFSLLSAAACAQAQNLLSNGGFETAGGIAGWDLEETITGMPGSPINSAEQINFANRAGEIAGEFGLWMVSFSGNIGDYMNQNKMINGVLSQTVPGTVGETYTFSGWSKFEENFSGGVDELAAGSPSMGGPSPTDTTIMLEFLNSGGGVIGSAVSLDVKTDRENQGFGFANDNLWYQHEVMGTAPPLTAKVRVTAAAYDMVFNVDPMQTAMFDDFSLMGTSATELLTNGDLSDPPPEFAAWEDTQVPGGTFPADPTVSAEGFAARTGSVGAWLRSFTGSAAQPADAILEQTVAGVEGGDYLFSGWANFQNNYSGGASGFDTQTLFEMEFLDESEQVIGDTLSVELSEDGQVNGAGWLPHFLGGTAPEGTVSVRVRAAALDMVVNPAGGQQSAFLDDFALMLTPADLEGDYNEDGIVDAADYVVWRKDPNAHGGTPGGYNTWRGNFGAMAGSGSTNLLAAAVPEPAGWMLMLTALMCGAGLRRHGA